MMRFLISCVVVAFLLLGQTAWGASGGEQVMVKSTAAPVQFGAADLRKALAAAKVTEQQFVISVGQDDQIAKILASLGVELPKEPESFVIARLEKTTAIAGSDEVGTMYGCFELAERLGMDGAKALELAKPVVQHPYVEFRAVNPFLTLPYGTETIDTWWFLSEDFWQGYIDQLARARINWIDLHGMYDIKTTDFPNLYAYFIKSDKFPDAGVPPEMADRNLAMLKKVMQMAKERGIKFALMNYSTYDGEYCRKNSYKWTDDEMADYTRECARKLIQACPDMLMFGFRIGESGKSEDFYKKSYIPAIRESGRAIDLYTRAWGTTKEQIVEIAQAFPGRLYVEIKYNGEQYGPPHIIAGGRTDDVAWRSDYSYTDYFTYPQPYKVIWQVRANGTHRVFPWGNPEFAARTAVNSHFGGAIGFCTEPINAYYPAYDYLHRDDSPLRWYKWIYQRDWVFYNLWGRMSYDPNVPQEVWIAKFKERFGKNAGPDIYRAFTTASLIVPYAMAFYAHGPDHRDYAVELETGGSVWQWANVGPFDTQNIQSPREYAERLLYTNRSARLSPLQAADMLDSFSADVLKYMELAKKAGCDAKEFKSLSADIEMLSYLGRYNAARQRSAAYYALYCLSHDQWAADTSRKYHGEAVSQWKNLASLGEKTFKPFVDTLRLKTEQFTWAKEAQRCRVDGTSLEDQIKPLEPLGLPKDVLETKGQAPIVKDVQVHVTPVLNDLKMLTLFVRADAPGGIAKVWLKYKPLPSNREWKTESMGYENGRWYETRSVKAEGLLWYLEIIGKNGSSTLWPDFRHEIPYKVVDSWDPLGSVLPAKE